MISAIFFTLLILKSAVVLFLELLNRRRMQDEVPADFKSLMTEEELAKASKYSLVKSKFASAEEILELTVLSVILLSGILPLAAGYLSGKFGGTTLIQAVFLLVSFGLFGLFSLPADIWKTFKIEAAFGFNKSTPRLFILDRIKGVLLAIVIGFPVIWFLLYLMAKMGSGWWWASAVSLTLFQFLMMILVPRVIMPLFNKFTPLEAGELKDRLMQLAQRSNFGASGIYIMDSSKRSGHSNAFFTGWGKYRRIVLFDTLVKQLTIDELEAVLAHEIGHFRLRHVLKRLVISTAGMFVFFYAASIFTSYNPIAAAFSFAEGLLTPAPSLLLFFLVFPALTFYLSPLSSLWSRRHEYQADRFASDFCDRKSLISALKKLSKENLSNLNPHPAYVAWHYSHPPLSMRLAALSGDKV